MEFKPSAIPSHYSIKLLWLALGVQASWLLLNGLLLHDAPGPDAIGAVIGLSAVAFAALHHRWRWSAFVLRIVMAVNFLLAVADRLGILGRPGTPSVSWGDFAHFVAYTYTLVPFLPRGLIPTLAVLATVAETVLGTALLIGLQLRLAALASAALLSVYGVCMTISLPPAQQFHYNVFVLAAGMLALANLNPASVPLQYGPITRLWRPSG